MDLQINHAIRAAQQNTTRRVVAKRIHIVLLGTLICAATQSHAAETERSSHRAEGRVAAKFQSADKDGDGALNREEAEAGGLKPVAKHFHRLDADRDGKVTREEVRSLLRSRSMHADESSGASIARQ